MRKFAVEQSEIAAVVVNAVSGMIVVLALVLPMSSLFTIPLIAVLSILFGPLVGFIVSSIYSRVEWAAGKKMGGKGSSDDLYRIFAWSFLLLGLAGLLYSAILSLFEKPTYMTSLVASIPSLVIAFLALRNYCTNIISTQEFTRKRGAASMLLTFTLFIMVIVGGIALLSIIVKYGSGKNLKWLLS